MSEFNEPWEAKIKTKPAFCGLKQTYVAILDSSGERVDRAVYESDEAIDRHAKVLGRVAACINACAGIPTEQLEDARRLLLSAGFHMTAAERQEYLERKSDEFRELAAKRTGVSIENDPRSVPPAHRTPLGIAIEDSRPVPGTELHEVRVQLPEAQRFAAPLKWRKEPPDEAGYYWVRFSADGEHGPSDLVEVAENESDGILYFHHCAKARRQFCGMGVQFMTQCEWAGPIEPPEAPA